MSNDSSSANLKNQPDSSTLLFTEFDRNQVLCLKRDEKVSISFQDEIQRQHLYDFLLKRGYAEKDPQLTRSKSTLEFVTGSKKSNGLSIEHDQYLGMGLRFFLDFHTKSSLGFFQRQKFNSIYFNPRVELVSKNKKYRGGFSYRASKLQRELNGGIVSDSLFIFSKDLNSDLNPVNLKQSYSLRKTKEVSLDNSIYIFKRDSSSSNTSMKGVELISELNYQTDKYGFYSTDTGFFESYFIDSSLTKDTSGLKSLKHELGVSFNFQIRNAIFKLVPFFGNGSYEYNVYNSKTYFKSYSFGSHINLSGQKGFIAFATLREDIVEGYDKNQKMIVVRTRKRLFENYFLNVSFLASESFSPLFSSRYYSNNFIWDNSFENEKLVSFSVKIADKKEADYIKVQIQNTNDYIYFDSLSVPSQYDKPIRVLKCEVRKEFLFMDFGVAPEIKFTGIDDENVYHFPKYILTPDIFYKKDVFKKKLTIKTGVKLFFYSSYYADDYVPATDSYFLQYKIKTGNYPVFDFYLDLKIKNAELFFKVNHFNDGLLDKDYFLTPHYPMPGRNILFGIKWQLIN